MYCPNCGKETSVDLNFCRGCGLGLEKITQTLAEQLPTPIDQNQQQLKEKIERQGVIALSIFGIGILSLLLYGVVYRVMYLEGRVLQGLVILGFIALILTGLWAAYLFAKANEVGNTSKKRRDLDATENALNPNLLSEGYMEPVSGVTERTTDLLFVKRKESNTKEI